MHATFYCEYLVIGDRQSKYNIMLTRWKTLIGFRMAYIFVHSIGQIQGHAKFDCEYLINGGRLDKYCYCQ